MDTFFGAMNTFSSIVGWVFVVVLLSLFAGKLALWFLEKPWEASQFAISINVFALAAASVITGISGMNFVCREYITTDWYFHLPITWLGGCVAAFFIFVFSVLPFRATYAVIYIAKNMPAKDDWKIALFAAETIAENSHKR